MKKLCIYHGNCADGFSAAWVVHQLLGDDADYFAATHGDPPPDVKGKDVIIVDFSYKRPVLDEMAAGARSILILDHHKTAADDLLHISKAPVWPSLEHALSYAIEHRIVAVFDLNRSGAQIAWDYFNPGKQRPRLVDYVGDRDLWQFKLQDSREVNAYVFAWAYTFTNWDFLASNLETAGGLEHVVNCGAAIERKHHKDVAELVEVTKRIMTIGGHQVPVANLPYTLTSDAGHLMAKDYPFAACYWDTPAGRVFSLRSRDGGMDVSQIAKQYGGGGHRHAAGFRKELGWDGDQQNA